MHLGHHLGLFDDEDMVLLSPGDKDGTYCIANASTILRLAAEGLSNREIGERLYLSHRTVGSHLYRLFPKLGVTSRVQLSAVIGPHRTP